MIRIKPDEARRIAANIAKLPEPLEAKINLLVVWLALHRRIEGHPGLLREIKHDGFRILARGNAAGMRLVSAGNDFFGPLPLYRTGREQAAGSVMFDRRRGMAWDRNK